MKFGSAYKIGCGDSVQFWDDIWLGESPLKIQCPYIHSVCSDPDKTVKQMLSGGEWEINLRRSLGQDELPDWLRLQDLLGTVQLTTKRDIMIWKLNPSGRFTTKSLYKEIVFGGVKDILLQELWKAPTPLKTRVFMWLMLQGRIQVAKKLKKMNWSGSPLCKLCGLE